MKNHAAYPEIGFLTKSFSKPHGNARAMPTAWELKSMNFSIIKIFRSTVWVRDSTSLAPEISLNSSQASSEPERSTRDQENNSEIRPLTVPTNSTRGSSNDSGQVLVLK